MGQHPLHLVVASGTQDFKYNPGREEGGAGGFLPLTHRGPAVGTRPPAEASGAPNPGTGGVEMWRCSSVSTVVPATALPLRSCKPECPPRQGATFLGTVQMLALPLVAGGLRPRLSQAPNRKQLAHSK